MLKVNLNNSEITAIIVIFNVTNVIIKCLEQLKDIPVIIVDNGKSNQEIISKIKKFKNIKKYIKSKKNIGFARANNFAFKYVKTKFSLLINPDVEINYSEIQKLLEIFKKYPETGIVVPTLINNKNEVIDNLELLPEKGKSIQRNSFEQKISDQLYNTFIEGDSCIMYCWGAIMLVNNDVVKKIGLFDKKFFMYWEDYDLCRKLYSKKISIIKTSASSAHHLVSSSVKGSILNFFLIQMYHVFSSYHYFKVDKKSTHLSKKAALYLFRAIGYLFILNFKNSLRNLARLFAVIKYKKTN